MNGASAAVRGDIYSPDLPWTTREPERLGQVIMQHVIDQEPYFRWWAQVWFENFQFLYGNHNLRWSRRHGFAVDYDKLSQMRSSAAERAQTNIARVVVEGLASLIYSNLPDWEVEAMEESQLKGKRFRKIAQKLLDAYMVRLCMDKEFQMAAISYVLFGQIAWRIDWNFGAGQLLEIPQFRKVRKPQFSTYMAPNPYTGGLLELPTPLKDQAGMPIMEDTWEEIVDEMGRQVVNKISAGDLFVNTRTPLEYQREIGSAGPHKARWWREFRILDYDEFLDEYKDVPGQTKAFQKIRPIYYNQALYEFAVRHHMRMMFTAPPTMDEAIGRQANSPISPSAFKYKVIVVEHFDRPHRDKWAEGRRVIVCNGEATHVTKPSYNVPGKMDGWHPYAESQWLVASPSSIAAGPMNDVTRKNRELNVADSLQATALRRNMGSQLLVKTGSGIEKERLVGEPGMAHEVSDVYGARWLHDEMPIPPAVPQLRQQIKDDVYEVSGAGDALRGQPSTGSNSGYQEKQREEREEKRLAPARKNWESGVATAGEKIYCCLKQNVVKLDDQVIGFLKRAGAGEFTVDDVIAFLKTPITFGVDIRVKKGSMALKSRATEMALYQELAQGPAGQRLATDAKVLDKYLQYFGAEVFRDASAAHRDRAERENEIFLDVLRLGPDTEGLKRPVVMFDDDDQIHLQEHQEFMVRYADELMGNEWLLMQLLEHMERHRLQDQEKQAQLPPGTSLQTGTMMAGARQQAAPTVQMVGQQAMLMKQQQAQQQQPPAQQQPPPKQQQPGGGGQAPGAQRQAPQAPRPGGRTDPQAPSGATPPARMSAGGTRA